MNISFLIGFLKNFFQIQKMRSTQKNLIVYKIIFRKTFFMVNFEPRFELIFDSNIPFANFFLPLRLICFCFAGQIECSLFLQAPAVEKL